MNRSRIFLACAFVCLFTPAPSRADTGKWELGAQFQSWNAYTLSPLNGSEFLAPFTFSISPWKNVNFYGQTEFADGLYTDSTTTTRTQNLAALTDSVAGFEAGFKTLSLPAILNVAFNIPTGDPSWETKQTAANIPIEFVDSRYRGRGFGISALYGVSLGSGPVQYGLAGGYQYSGAFNPFPGVGTTTQLKLGDSVFLALTRMSAFSSNRTEVIRASASLSLPSEQGGADSVWMGPNFILSYSWTDPKGFSFEAGGQYFLPLRNSVNGQWITEPFNSLAPRFYVNPGWNFGDFTVSGRAKMVLLNGYPVSDTLHYDGGGYLFGIEPSYRVKMDAKSALRVSVSYDDIIWKNGGYDTLGDRADIQYNRWTFGTTYEYNF